MPTKKATTVKPATKPSTANRATAKPATVKPAVARPPADNAASDKASAALAKAASAKRKKFLLKVQESLGEMKTKLLGEMESELKAEREGNKDEGMDTYDLASEERDREISFILSDRERVKIKQIDDAIERLEEGSYGVCESCGLEIGEERLQAMPFSRLCRDCQQDQEREARTQRRFEDERNVYRKLGSTDNEEESG